MRHLTVESIHYFTARVKDRPTDLQLAQRQDTYIRALETRSLITVTYGQFAQRDKTLPTTGSLRAGRTINFATVRTQEEKGSDVNLASHLLRDAFRDQFDTAIVLSNDSDLQTPIDMVRDQGKRVLVVNPHYHAGQADHLFGSGPIRLRKSHLARHQLPDPVTDARGRRIRKPPDW